MNKKRNRVILVLSIILSVLLVNNLYARGILGTDLGDRSSDDNEKWLKNGVKHLQLAIKAAIDKDQSMSLKHGKESMLALKEIASEGWAPKLEKAFKKVRYGIRASQKGDLEKASMNYQLALKKVESLKFGDLIWTHESFMGIGDHRGK
ncbi:MAG: hypothetical protein V3V22_02025 [Methylococcales bacterium]